jgi:peptide/nickel transport system ATP-binding protein/oligopeptide transport system ATP-binding protein
MSTSAPPLLDVTGLSKHFTSHRGGLFRGQTTVVKALDGISFTLRRGATLGLVGESGCGKSTAARCILRAINPTAGTVRFFDGSAEGVDLARLDAAALIPLRRRMQMVFQDPFSSLNPRLTIGQTVAEPLLVHGLGNAAERRKQVSAMLERVGLGGDRLHRYPHEFSGGQRQRIAIARALILRPSLVIFDEAVSALDVSVQAQVINLIADLRQEFQLTSIFVSHDLSVVRHLCDEVVVMYAGRIVEHASTQDLFKNPRHPYTRALLATVPSPDPRIRMQTVLMGEVADPAHPPSGCTFHPRCSACQDHCRETPPACLNVGDRRLACHRAEDLLQRL